MGNMSTHEIGCPIRIGVYRCTCGLEPDVDALRRGFQRVAENGYLTTDDGDELAARVAAAAICGGKHATPGVYLGPGGDFVRAWP